MNAVIYYSNTGQSKLIADYLSKRLEYVLINIETNDVKKFDNLVLVFPVYCQNIPSVVKGFLSDSEIKELTVISTYGKMCPGNVLYEIQNNYKHKIVAAAYIPTKHSYIKNDVEFNEFDKLDSIIDKMKNSIEIKLPKMYKNPLSNVFPDTRSRLGLKIIRSKNCTLCGVCNLHCNYGAIDCGLTNNKCIRCLKCVNVCPNKSLEVKISLPLKLYLSKKKMNKTIIYI